MFFVCCLSSILLILRYGSEFEADCCRHIFADKLYVEEYRAADFQTELGLNRQKLIYLALLLGSDYTEGINGIGIVNAVHSLFNSNACWIATHTTTLVPPFFCTVSALVGMH